ncbi:MAG TPA: hypothetical protein PKD10_16300 [Paracoccaceae bacterium]|nr:hypothetical protein [Paracoccaceae bacterium]HMO73059.1 hypothetical protein [Paracoccaceae bacterium]
MIRPRTLWLPVAALAALAAVVGALQGTRVAAGGETAAIEAAAARWLASAGPGARAADCAARPDPGWFTWLVVTCRGAPGGRVYYIGRLGFILRETALPPLPET